MKITNFYFNHCGWPLAGQAVRILGVYWCSGFAWVFAFSVHKILFIFSNTVDIILSWKQNTSLVIRIDQHLARHFLNLHILFTCLSSEEKLIEGTTFVQIWFLIYICIKFYSVFEEDFDSIFSFSIIIPILFKHRGTLEWFSSYACLEISNCL